MKFRIEPIQHPGFIPVPDTCPGTGPGVSSLPGVMYDPDNRALPMTGAMRGTGSITVMPLRMSY